MLQAVLRIRLRKVDLPEYLAGVMGSKFLKPRAYAAATRAAWAATENPPFTTRTSKGSMASVIKACPDSKTYIDSVFVGIPDLIKDQQANALRAVQGLSTM
jgi:hypothetical protein